MAKTRDYMDYLDDTIEIAPANSQEEYQAAETIAQVLRDHELETNIEEFDAHPMGKLAKPILMCLLLVLFIVMFLTEGVLHVIMILLSAAIIAVPLVEH
ncbi:MAG: hypothetical protein Q4B54_13075, partial [Coriobacteriales bacterium]|nr:hypothetical protein [Coriobacteriales bacterium]